MKAVYRPRGRTLLAALPILWVAGAHGDVTIEQRMQVDGPGGMKFLNMTGTTVTVISGERSRTDSDLKMESRLMRMFGGGSIAEIVRLDQEKVYQLDLKKKTYSEATFEEQRAALAQSMEQMREAQAQQPQPGGIDESDCEWSEPTSKVDRRGEKDTIAGFEAERMIVTASQSCTDRNTGQVCSFNLVLDQWLAPTFEASEEVTNHYQAYAQKLGLEVAQSREFAQRIESMFGGYEGIWSEIAEQMQQLQGYPVRSTVSLAIGGPQCQAADEAASAEPDRPGIGEAVGGAIGGALGGFLGRRRDQAQRQAEAQPAPAAAADPSLPEGTVRLMSISSELVSVRDDDVPDEIFEIPAGFRAVRD
ncbi:MAG TPA: hypothetical protein VF210_00910 [Pseudomonadales bacterium]